MPRPKKQTVNWFPHSCTHGKTIFVLEKKYQLQGYAFWFKLLEVLGSSEGHFYNFNDPGDKEFLQAYTGGGEETEEMLDLLSSLDAIDQDAWKAKIIWSANFIKGIAQTYVNRRVTPPPRPDNYIKEYSHNGITTRSLHKKVQEGKGREGKGIEGEKDIAPPGPPDSGGTSKIFSGFFSCSYFEVDLDYRIKLAKEYPALTDDLLRKELSKMEDWVSDNAQKKKFKANGHLANPKLFIKNWLDRVGGILGPGSDKPKGFAAVQRFMERGEGNG
jgi:hypothetical protein